MYTISMQEYVDEERHDSCFPLSEHVSDLCARYLRAQNHTTNTIPCHYYYTYRVRPELL